LKARQKIILKMERKCRVYRNPILEFNVGHMSFENERKACGAQVISTIRGGMARHMDWGFLEKA
jgi:hypothetical protein